MRPWPPPYPSSSPCIFSASFETASDAAISAYLECADAMEKQPLDLPRRIGDITYIMPPLFPLMYLMLPAYLANMAPPFTRFWRGWNRPISRKWLGEHK